MRANASDSSTIEPQFARSWLLISGSDCESYSAEADARVIDLEDGVVTRRRQAARRDVADFLHSNRAWVRINPCGTRDCEADIDAVRSAAGLLGVMLAKSECPNQVASIARELPGVRIVALVESALGVERAFEIAAAPGTFRIAFGKGDYRRDTLISNDPVALGYARGRLVNASRAAGLPGPVDGPCLTGMPDLGDALTVAKSAGMTGMLCLQPEDVPVINGQLSPSPDDVIRAERTIARLGFDGENVAAGCDLPLLGWAKRTLELAHIYDFHR